MQLAYQSSNKVAGVCVAGRSRRMLHSATSPQHHHRSSIFTFAQRLLFLYTKVVKSNSRRRKDVSTTSAFPDATGLCSRRLQRLLPIAPLMNATTCSNFATGPARAHWDQARIVNISPHRTRRRLWQINRILPHLTGHMPYHSHLFNHSPHTIRKTGATYPCRLNMISILLP